MSCIRFWLYSMQVSLRAAYFLMEVRGPVSYGWGSTLTRPIPGLDGIRTLAILLVVMHHAHLLSGGWIGVQIFFVLSGFLITGILIDASNARFGEYVRNFYGRRFLRIFPVYYAYLGVIAIGSHFFAHWPQLADASRQMPYALTYTYDLYASSKSWAFTPFLSHFWSLAVEEQFYLVWPFIVYFCSRRRLITVLWSLVALAPVFRFTLFRYNVGRGWDPDTALFTVYVFPLSTLDAFATGALLAIVRPAVRGSHAIAAGLVVVALGLAERHVYHCHAFATGLRHAWGFVWGYSVLNLAAGLLIAAVAGGAFRSVFCNRTLSYVGRISYGVYIFHYSLMLLSHSIAFRRLPPRAAPFGDLGLDLILAIAIASASYRWLEKPFLAKKDVWFGRRPPAPRQPWTAMANSK